MGWLFRISRACRWLIWSYTLSTRIYPETHMPSMYYYYVQSLRTGKHIYYHHLSHSMIDTRYYCTWQRWSAVVANQECYIISAIYVDQRPILVATYAIHICLTRQIYSYNIIQWSNRFNRYYPNWRRQSVVSRSASYYQVAARRTLNRNETSAPPWWRLIFCVKLYL